MRVETQLTSARFFPSDILVLESFKVSWAKAAKVLKEFDRVRRVDGIDADSIPLGDPLGTKNVYSVTMMGHCLVVSTHPSHKRLHCFIAGHHPWRTKNPTYKHIWNSNPQIRICVRYSSPGEMQNADFVAVSTLQFYSWLVKTPRVGLRNLQIVTRPRLQLV